MSVQGWILVAVGAFVLMRAMQYVLVARTYLTAAARQLNVQAVEAGEIDPECRELLESCDSELVPGGFQFERYAYQTPLLTTVEGRELIRVLASVSEPIRVILHRRPLPEAGKVVSVYLQTVLANGRVLQTANEPTAAMIQRTTIDTAIDRDADVATLLRTHRERLAAIAESADRIRNAPDHTIAEFNAQKKALQRDLTARGYTVETADPALDRFTLWGSFALAHASIKASAKARAASRTKPKAAVSGRDLHLRAVADIMALRAAALNPIRAPGSSQTLWTLMAVTAGLSFLAMSVAWSAFTASIILMVIAFHEAGHALAMRSVGYRDVHVFFVPLVGALTVGRDNGASLRQRLAVILAGPVPGLWLAVALLLLPRFTDWLSVPGKRGLIFGLLAINGLNLLPITPFDGGRAIEALTRPNSRIRIALHAVSGVGLLALAAYFRGYFLTILGIWWLLLLPQQLRLLNARRLVAARLDGSAQREQIIRTTCEVLSMPAYTGWRFLSRAALVRSLVQQFSQPPASGVERLQCALAYASSWVPVFIAATLWKP